MFVFGILFDAFHISLDTLLTFDVIFNLWLRLHHLLRRRPQIGGHHSLQRHRRRLLQFYLRGPRQTRPHPRLVWLIY
jgi:hypothetical protein